jgi:hypothetical protein
MVTVTLPGEALEAVPFIGLTASQDPPDNVLAATEKLTTDELLVLTTMFWAGGTGDPGWEMKSRPAGVGSGIAGVVAEATLATTRKSRGEFVVDGAVIRMRA